MLSASLFLALLMSSPFLLAYASVPMTEMLGALAQLLVLLAYVHYHHDPTPRAARLFAVSLTILFFTTYNYFLLLATPLVLFEWLEQTSGWNAGRRLTSLWRSTWRIFSTTTGALAGLYLFGLLIIVRMKPVSLPISTPFARTSTTSGVSPVCSSFLPWLPCAIGQQPPLLKWLILGVPLQFAVIAFHHTRSPRFLLLTVVLLCLAAASEVGQWFAGSRRRRVAATLLASLVLASGVLAAHEVVTRARFRAIAFENYTESETLRAAFGSIRADLGAGDRLVVVGRGNELSPGLLRWELGPPTGVPCFPFEVGGARGIDLALATRVLLIVPLDGEAASLDVTNDYLAQRSDVLERLSRGQLVFRRELPVPDMHVAFRLYDRAPESDLKAPCQ